MRSRIPSSNTLADRGTPSGERTFPPRPASNASSARVSPAGARAAPGAGQALHAARVEASAARPVALVPRPGDDQPSGFARPPCDAAGRRAIWHLGLVDGFRRVIQLALFYLLLLHLGAMSLVWNIGCAIAYPFIPRRHGIVVGRAAISSVYRVFWACCEACGLMRIDFGDLDALRRDGGLIIAANHPSMLDALLVIARVPRGICIMKSNLMRSPFLGAGARLARYIRNEPTLGMVTGCVENLRAGGQLVLFPEGTRTIEKPINPFRPGITLIAQLAGVPIQTVLIETASPYLAKGWPIWKPPAFPVAVRVRLGQRFAPEPDHQSLLKRLEAYFAAQLPG